MPSSEHDIETATAVEDGEEREVANFLAAVLAKRRFDEGHASGFARGLQITLEVRGMAVTAEIRVLIANCTTLRQLQEWVRRAAIATTLEDVFERLTGAETEGRCRVMPLR